MSLHIIPEKDTFSTENYWLAAALLAAGNHLLRLKWQGSRAAFVFSDPERCDESSRAHWSGDLKVSTKDFVEAMRSLKSQLYDDKHKNKDYDKPQHTSVHQ